VKKRTKRTVKVPQALMFDLNAKGEWVSRARAPWKKKVEFDGGAWMATVLAAADSRILVEVKPEE